MSISGKFDLFGDMVVFRLEHVNSILWFILSTGICTCKMVSVSGYLKREVGQTEEYCPVIYYTETVWTCWDFLLYSAPVVCFIEYLCRN